MPYYEYRCQNCSVVSAAIHGMNDKYTKPCEFCKHTEYEQIIFTPSLKFTGTGFYETDYKGKS